MPVRMLKDWTASERIDLLSPQAEIFFIRLIMKADDHGCFHGNPKLLNSLLFPLKEYSFSDVLTWRTECQKAGIIKVYTHEGQNYIQIINFGQRLRTMNSKFPQPADNCLTNDIKEPPELEENRREDEVEEKEKNAAIALPFDSENFKTVWNEWVKFRKEIKNSLKPTTIQKQLKFLGAKNESEAVAILNQSMINGWTGLFELKNNNNAKPKNTNSAESFTERTYAGKL
jgi:hypothetical protein